MITRRSVRIKAMQYIYACETANSADIKHFEQNLQKSIFSVKDQYLYLLLFIREIANFAEKDAQIKSSKHLKSNDDKLVNTKLLSNFLIQFWYLLQSQFWEVSENICHLMFQCLLLNTRQCRLINFLLNLSGHLARL